MSLLLDAAFMALMTPMTYLYGKTSAKAFERSREQLSAGLCVRETEASVSEVTVDRVLKVGEQHARTRAARVRRDARAAK